MEFAIIIPVALIALAPVVLVGSLILWKLYDVYRFFKFVLWKHRCDNGGIQDMTAATLYGIRFGYYPDRRAFISRENAERCARWERRLYGEATPHVVWYA